MNRLLDYITKHVTCEKVTSDKLFRYAQLKVNEAIISFKKHNTGYWVNVGELPTTDTLIQMGTDKDTVYYYGRCNPVISFAILPARATAYLIEIKPTGRNMVYLILNDNYIISGNVSVVSLKHIHQRLISALTKLQAAKSLDHFYDLHKNH